MRYNHLVVYIANFFFVDVGFPKICVYSVSTQGSIFQMLSSMVKYQMQGISWEVFDTSRVSSEGVLPLFQKSCYQSVLY